MSPKERFLAATRNGIPDRVPVAPDISNFIPCKRTGLPFWDIYFNGKVPLWRAYLAAADYYGIDLWMASCTGLPVLWEETPCETETETVYDKGRDAMVRKWVTHTPEGDLTSTSVCYRGDPPSPTEKPMKDLVADWKKYKLTMATPRALDRARVEEMRTEAHRREQAFGLCIGYPGFQAWCGAVQGGVAPLSYAEMDTPAILEEWCELDVARGTRLMELMLEAEPDYILFGGSGTITLASPALAMKYAIPALKAWSKTAADAGIPTQLHSCGKSRILVDMLADETDVNLINPLEEAPMGDVDLAETKRARGNEISLMGNLHTTEVMLRGTPELVRQKAIEAMRAAGRGGGFVLSAGDQCGRETPDENIFALVEAAKQYGRYDPVTGELPDLPPA